MQTRNFGSDRDFWTLLNVGDPHGSTFLSGPQLLLACVTLAIFAGLLGYLFGTHEDAVFTAATALLAGYMAANIGANDVANSVGPLVGARALKMGAALFVAAIAEIAGALLAGDHITSRIAYRIVDPNQILDPVGFVHGMLSALAGAGLWVHLANRFRAPISTTHAIFGGILGAAFVALGSGAINWPEVSSITVGWFVSPLASGLIAAAILAFIKSELLDPQDKIRAARTWIPILVAAMAALFAFYLVSKGLAKIWQPKTPVLVTVVVLAFVGALSLTGPYIRRSSMHLANRAQAVRALFRVPLIAAGAFLAFAHGANDIANIAGPVTAILHVQETSDLDIRLSIPYWIFVLGALGIASGLLLFGPGMVRVVGSRITKINPLRAYAVAMATAITVTAASWVDLPVSTTQIAVGAIFGIGIYRELRNRRAQQLQSAEEGKKQKRPRLLIRRADTIRILIAWTITFPSAAAISAVLYWLIEVFA